MKRVPGKNGGTINEFEKGESGNPKGRPRKLPEIDDLLAEVLGEEEGIEARGILHALLKKAKRGDVRAAEVLLDRAYGKAKQEVKNEISGSLIVRWEEPNLQHPQNKGSYGELPSVQEGLSDNLQPGGGLGQVRLSR